MRQRAPGAVGWGLLLLAVAAGATAVVAPATSPATIEDGTLPASCTSSPAEVDPGETVTLDASASTETTFVEFDVDGDGEYEVTDEDDFVIEITYDEPGSYEPVARADGDSSDTDACGTVTVSGSDPNVSTNRPPTANLTVDQNPANVDQRVTLSAASSTDGDGSIVEYRWDFEGDGTVDRITEVETIEHAYGTTGEYTPTVTVVDDDGANDTATTDLTVEGPNQFPRINLVFNRSYPEAGDPIELDVSDSDDPDGSIVEYRWDFEGDGTVDRVTTEPVVIHVYEEGSYNPTVSVVDDDGAIATERKALEVRPASTTARTGDPGPGGTETVGPTTPDGTATVAAPTPTSTAVSNIEDAPWVPIAIGGGGLLGLGSLGYYVFGGPAGGGGGSGGGGGGGSGGRTTPKPRPKPDAGEDLAPRYESGVFELPVESGTFSVSVGFDPDLLTFRAANGARTDGVVDRTAGWSRGIVLHTSETEQSRSATVADDAHTGDQATCAVSSDAAIQLLRHADDAPPGRVSVRVVDTTSDGVEVDVTVPGDDPLASGVRVLFTAVRADSETNLDVGTFHTATAPGTQTVDLGLDADHVSLTATSAVGDTDSLWTTDRSTGVTLGYAVRDESDNCSQALAAVGAWPGAGSATAAASNDDAALDLLYQDGDRVAGRTSARVTSLGETLRLRYDRAYSGPHKLGSTARHPVSYLSVSSETIRPAVGTVSLPAAGTERSVDCGFAPGLIELTVVPAAAGEYGIDATASPFGWSQGSAVVSDGTLRQYVVHHSVPAEPVPPIADALAGEMRSPAGAPQETLSDGGDSDAGVPATDALPTDVRPVDLVDEGDPLDLTPTEYDDGRVGLWLARGPDGAVCGRDELRVTGTTDSGFDLGVTSVDAGERSDVTRPTVVYRAWPAVDGDGGGATPVPQPGTPFGTSDRESTITDSKPDDERT